MFSSFFPFDAFIHFTTLIIFFFNCLIIIIFFCSCLFDFGPNQIQIYWKSSFIYVIFSFYYWVFLLFIFKLSSATAFMIQIFSFFFHSIQMNINAFIIHLKWTVFSICKRTVETIPKITFDSKRKKQCAAKLESLDVNHKMLLLVQITTSIQIFSFPLFKSWKHFTTIFFANIVQ